MRRILACIPIAVSVAFAACGFDGFGGVAGVGPNGDGSSGNAAAPGTAAGEAGGPESTEVEAPPLVDAGTIFLDSSAPFDAGTQSDAAPLPASPGSPLVYVISTRFWTFNPTTNAWGGGTQLPVNNCPYLDELAVDPFGKVFAVGNGGTQLYHVDPGALTCTAIGAAAAGYPQALSFAPRGTLNPGNEELVGYVANGDYVRLDITSGAVSLVKAGALAGYTVGDLANVGAKGYVAVTGGACGAGDCILQVSLTTGLPIGGPGKLPATRHVTALAHWGGKLYAFCERDEVYAIDPANPGAAPKLGGPPNFYNIAFRGAGSRTIAPTQ